MKHPHLPQYFAIKRDENNPLWEEYIQWVISESGDTFWGHFEYVGFDGCGLFNGYNASRSSYTFNNPVTIITLSEWKNAIDKTEDMKETEFMQDHSRDEAMAFHKATRGKGVKPEFDPSKPFEVSHYGEHWHTAHHYIGLTSKGEHLVEINDHGVFGTWKHIRNVEPFHAGMLNYGQYMIVDDPDLPPGSDPAVLVRTEHGGLVNIKTGEQWADLSAVKGRRVRVNITTEEI